MKALRSLELAKGWNTGPCALHLTDKTVHQPRIGGLLRELVTGVLVAAHQPAIGEDELRAKGLQQDTAFG